MSRWRGTGQVAIPVSIRVDEVGDDGHFVPLLPVELAPARLRADAAPLLEEECNMVPTALFAKRANPLTVDGAVPGAGLAACDQPMNVRQVESRQRAEQWLRRDEPHPRRHP